MDPAPPADWLVACLCAAWCGSCRDYRATFEALARERGDCRFVWVDIEDQADALAPFELDIDDFPTVLIARLGGLSDDLRFLGALTPQPDTLLQTLAAAQRGSLMATRPSQASALVACIGTIGEAVR